MRDIEGYENYYAVTECGKVYSKRYDKFLRHGEWVDRYRTVVLTVNYISKCISVHRLVAIAYIDNPGNKPQVNHIDGDKLNNHASNLEWCTNKENSAHAFKLGLRKPSSKTFFKKGFDPRRAAKNKLSNEDVIAIRARSEQKETYRSISKDYPVNESQIRRCCKRETYGSII